MAISIKIDNLADGNVIHLLEEHHREMYLYSPPGSVHALDSSKLTDSSLTFWSAWDGDHLAGCGALKQLNEVSGEIKSMRTAKRYLRQGIAQAILGTILLAAKDRKYQRLSLETGTHAAFLPAVSLYKKFGFTECGPFGEYVMDPYSLFLTKAIDH